MRDRWRLRRDLLCIAAAVGVLGPGTAVADPIEFVEQRANYMVFEDPSAALPEANWWERDPFLAHYADIESGFLAVHPDDSQFLVIYTTWSLPDGIGAFFQSLSNDIQGIGFEHIAPEDAIIPEPYFDDTPNSQITGFLHMNRWSQYAGGDRGGVDDWTISLIFGQELGHAWGSFVYYQENQAAPWNVDMLGRANAHWSFYMNAGPSPMQGHEWLDNGDGTFTAVPADLFVYNDLDLYLMGLLPAAEVDPWFWLENPSNCVNSALPEGACADPDGFLFQADTYSVTATRRDVTIDMVQAVEGPRVPAWPEAPDTYDVSFLFVKLPGEQLTALELDFMDTVVERSIELFEVQTSGLGHIVNRTAAPGPGGDSGDSGSATSSADDTAGVDASTDDSSAPSTEDASASASNDGNTAAPGDDTSASENGASDATGDAADDEATSGCSCTSSGDRGVPWWAAAWLLGLCPRRRS